MLEHSAILMTCIKRYSVLSGCLRQVLLYVYSRQGPYNLEIFSVCDSALSIRAKTCDFQQCRILISVDSDEHVKPPFKFRDSKRCSVSSLTLIEYAAYYCKRLAKALIRLCVCAGSSRLICGFAGHT